MPWSWAVERLIASHNYFVATTRPSGQPPTVCRYGVYGATDAFASVPVDNPQKHAISPSIRHCVVTIERADEAVIVEGVATASHDRERLAPSSRAKFSIEPASSTPRSIRFTAWDRPSWSSRAPSSESSSLKWRPPRRDGSRAERAVALEILAANGRENYRRRIFRCVAVRLTPIQHHRGRTTPHDTEPETIRAPTCRRSSANPH